MSTMTHIRDVRKKAPMVTGLFGPLKDTVLLLKSRGIPMDLPPVNNQVTPVFSRTPIPLQSDEQGGFRGRMVCVSVGTTLPPVGAWRRQQRYRLRVVAPLSLRDKLEDAPTDLFARHLLVCLVQAGP